MIESKRATFVYKILKKMAKSCKLVDYKSVEKAHSAVRRVSKPGDQLNQNHMLKQLFIKQTGQFRESAAILSREKKTGYQQHFKSRMTSASDPRKANKK